MLILWWSVEENVLHHKWICPTWLIQGKILCNLQCCISGTDYLVFQTDRVTGGFIRNFRSPYLGEVIGNRSYMKRSVRRIHGDCFVVSSVVCALSLFASLIFFLCEFFMWVDPISCNSCYLIFLLVLSAWAEGQEQRNSHPRPRLPNSDCPSGWALKNLPYPLEMKFVNM